MACRMYQWILEGIYEQSKQISVQQERTLMECGEIENKNAIPSHLAHHLSLVLFYQTDFVYIFVVSAAGTGNNAFS